MKSHNAVLAKELKRLKVTKRRRQYTHCCHPKAPVRVVQFVSCAISELTLCVTNKIVSEGSSLDIVRELAFISTDGGISWRAEVSLHCCFRNICTEVAHCC